VVETTRRRRRSRILRDVSQSTISQLKRHPLKNRFAPVSPLSDEQVELIHEASMNLLEDLGIEVLGEHALAVFKKAGAEVGANGIVRLDRNLVEESVKHAPASFVAHARNSENNINVGADHICFGMVSGTPNVHDHINGRRMGNMADYKKLIMFGQYFNCITFFGNQATAPTDLPVNSRHLDTALVNLTLSDKPSFSTGIGAGRILDAAKMTAIALNVSLDDLTSTPCTMTNININSPRKLDDSMAYSAMQLAQMGQPVTVTPFTLMGAMTPATLGAALVQQNAEALFGITLLQLVNPGTPAIYGGFTSNVDMRSGAPTFGTPENSLANMAGGQLARYYNLPHRTSACNASNAVDVQATYETQMSLWGAVLGHGNLIYHSAGWLEGGLVASFEKIITDCEMLQQMSELLKPIDLSLDNIGMEAMQEVSPGGHFFGCDHTMARYKTAFYQPFLSDYKNHENWLQAGGKDATTRATEIWPKILHEFEAPPTDPAILEALEAYVATRKEALGTAEPKLEPDWV